MLRRLNQVLYHGTSVSFPGGFDLEESVPRLQKAVSPETFWELLTMEIKDNCPGGTVAKDKVVLRWFRSFLHNSFAPPFVGRFEQDKKQVVLKGYFLAGGAKIFLVLLFGLAGCIVPLGTLSLVFTAPL